MTQTPRGLLVLTVSLFGICNLSLWHFPFVLRLDMWSLESLLDILLNSPVIQRILWGDVIGDSCSDAP